MLALYSLYSLASAVMRGFAGIVAAGALLTGVSVQWVRFSSTLYPYSIQQPSTFRHLSMTTASGRKADYFFPIGTGSFPTNVNIVANRGQGFVSAASYLKSVTGQNVRRVGWVQVDGHRVALTRADFSGLTGPWTEEQVSFTDGGYVWHLTISYEPRFRKYRAMMLKMIGTFQVGTANKRKAR